VPLAEVLQSVADGQPFLEIAQVFELTLQQLIAVLQFAAEGAAPSAPGRLKNSRISAECPTHSRFLRMCGKNRERDRTYERSGTENMWKYPVPPNQKKVGWGTRQIESWGDFAPWLSRIEPTIRLQTVAGH